MKKAIGFDNDKYVKMQSEKILERINLFNNKLYLEFGGKLFDDYHASRVLPGFAPDAKIKLLCNLKDKVEIIFVISAGDIERNKIRADFGITYGMDVMRLIDNLRNLGIMINSVVITQYKGQAQADIFKRKLEMRGEKVYVHTLTKGYPMDVNTIVSDEGYGANPYIETTRPLVVVTAPGPGSGKLATCLSQLYHESKRGVTAGYAKFETFPIWNLPLKHPVNVAYESATVDIGDFNMIDPYHLEAYGETTVNYNRDVEAFPLLKKILTKITGNDTLYKSPTDMGVNMAGCCIVDDDVCREASKQEIIRRFYKTKCDYKMGLASKASAQRSELIMSEVSVTLEDRKVVSAATEKNERTGVPCMAVQLEDGRIVTGKQTDLMNPSSSVVLNAIKMLAGIKDEIPLISHIVLEPILHLKRKILGVNNYILNLEDVLVALSVSASTNPLAELAMSKLAELKGMEAHSTHMLAEVDAGVFRRLKINVTCESEFPTKELYFK